MPALMSQPRRHSYSSARLSVGMDADIPIMFRCLVLITYLHYSLAQGSSSAVTTTMKPVKITSELIPTGTKPTVAIVTTSRMTTVQRELNLTTQPSTDDDTGTNITVQPSIKPLGLKVVLRINELLLNDPDDKVVHTGGGQAFGFTVEVSSSEDSSAVSGDNNWELETFVTSLESGNHVSPVAEIQQSEEQRVANLLPGDNYTFNNVGVTLNLTATTCQEVNHFCIRVGPSASANWTLGVGSENVKCTDISCAGQGSIVVIHGMLIPAMLSLLTIL